jgi:outer membrane receptor protein involved in Fe transport
MPKLTTFLVAAAPIALLAASGAQARTQQQSESGTQPDAAAANPVQKKNSAASGTPSAIQSKEDEIVITAEKKKERLIDAPLAISVMSNKRMKALQINDLSDLSDYVPGLSVNSQGHPGQRTVTIRGLATDWNDALTAPLVGIYVDDIQIGSSSPETRAGQNSIDLQPVDLASIEVLRGPQGTLYGANAMGGIIRYTLFQPDLQHVKAEAGTDASFVDHGSRLGWSGDAAVSAPIIEDKLAVRVSGFYRRYPGYIDNIGIRTGVKDSNSAVQKGGLVSLLWKPTSRLTIHANLIAQNLHSNDESAAAYDQAAGRLVYNYYTNNTKFPNVWDSQARSYSLHADYDLGFGTLTSATGWNSLKSVSNTDLSFFGFFCDPSVLPPGCPDYPHSDALATYLNRITTHRFSEELRLASTPSGPLQWLVGGLWSAEHSTFSEDVPAYKPDYTPLSPVIDNLLHDQWEPIYREAAIFGNVTYTPFRHFDLTAGMRYSKYMEAQTQASQYGTFFGGPTPVPLPDFKVPWTGVATWLANARWHFRDDAMVYARVATGYRAGTHRPTRQVPIGNGQFVTLQGDVQPDKTIDYEVGVKGLFFDHHLMMDADAFWINWTNMQINNVIGTGQFTYIYPANVGSARSRGVELAATYWILTGLQVQGNITYTDAILTANAPAISGVYGAQLPTSAKWSGSASLDYDRPLSPTASMLLGINYQYRGPMYTAISSNPAAVFLPPRKSVGAYAGVRLNNYVIELVAKNLFNQKGYTGFSGDGLSVVQPRMITLSANVAF